MDSRKKHSRRRRLYARQRGMCYWCLCLMRSPDPRLRDKEPVPDDYPTIDHLDERFTERRGKMVGERTVLACRVCNNHRSNDNMSVAERRARTEAGRRRVENRRLQRSQAKRVAAPSSVGLHSRPFASLSVLLKESSILKEQL